MEKLVELICIVFFFNREIGEIQNSNVGIFKLFKKFFLLRIILEDDYVDCF